MLNSMYLNSYLNQGNFFNMGGIGFGGIYSSDYMSGNMTGQVIFGTANTILGAILSGALNKHSEVTSGDGKTQTSCVSQDTQSKIDKQLKILNANGGSYTLDNFETAATESAKVVTTAKTAISTKLTAVETELNNLKEPEAIAEDATDEQKTKYNEAKQKYDEKKEALKAQKIALEQAKNATREVNVGTDLPEEIQTLLNNLNTAIERDDAVKIAVEELSKLKETAEQESGLYESLNAKDGSWLSRKLDGDNTVKDKMNAFKRAQAKYMENPYSLNQEEIDTLKNAGNLISEIQQGDKTEPAQQIVKGLQAWSKGDHDYSTVEAAIDGTLNQKQFQAMDNYGCFTKKDRMVGTIKQTVYIDKYHDKQYILVDGTPKQVEHAQKGNLFHKAQFKQQQ